MSRPYKHKGHDGYSFIGHRMHPEAVGHINALLARQESLLPAEGYVPFQARSTGPPVHERFTRPHRSTILERFISQPQLLQSLADIAMRVKLPDHWDLGHASANAAEEHHRQSRLELLQLISEAAIEAAA